MASFRDWLVKHGTCRCTHRQECHTPLGHVVRNNGCDALKRPPRATSWQPKVVCERFRPQDRRVTIAVGPNDAQRNAVVAMMRRDAETSEFDHATVVALPNGESDREVWASLNQHPMVDHRLIERPDGKRPLVVPMTRHVTVLDAHNIRMWDQLEDWLKTMTSVTAIFEMRRDVDEELWRGRRKRCPRGHDLTREGNLLEVGRKREQHCARCRKIHDLLVQHGRWVECADLTTHVRRQAIGRVLAEQFGMALTTAEMVLRTCRWDYGTAARCVQKLVMLGRQPHLISHSDVQYVLPRDEETAFEQALLYDGQRSRAVEAAWLVPEDEIPRIIDRCDRWLGHVTRALSLMSVQELRQMATSARNQATAQSQVATRLNVDFYTAGHIMESAPRYRDSTRLRRATLALADASVQAGRGNTVGVLELLAVNW